MFVAVNTIKIPTAHQATMIEAFRKNAPDLKQFNGFLGFDIWTSENDSLLAISRWESKEAFEQYIHSDAFKQHHGGEGSDRMRAAAEVSYYAGETIV
jgi:heme-degrading monooxygenase HmoA